MRVTHLQKAAAGRVKRVKLSVTRIPRDVSHARELELIVEAMISDYGGSLLWIINLLVKVASHPVDEEESKTVSPNIWLKSSY